MQTPGLTSPWTPRVEPITYPTPDGAEAHALLYRPRNPGCVGPEDDRCPLVVTTRGGPTGNAAPRLSAAIVYWTSRGIAVVDVNDRGSTGYGRAYRVALKGRWGLSDVTDAIAAARFLAGRGEVDTDRMVIRGESAGGFTTLAVLVAEDHPSAAGASPEHHDAGVEGPESHHGRPAHAGCCGRASSTEVSSAVTSMAYGPGRQRRVARP